MFYVICLFCVCGCVAGPKVVSCCILWWENLTFLVWKVLYNVCDLTRRLTEIDWAWNCWVVNFSTSALLYTGDTSFLIVYSLVLVVNSWVLVRTNKGALHQRGSNLIRVQSWLWSQFRHNLCCTTAVQIIIRLELGLTLNRRMSWDQILISVQVAFTHAHCTLGKK